MLKFKTDESKIYFSKHIDVNNLEMCFFKNDKIKLIISMNKNIRASFFDSIMCNKDISLSHLHIGAFRLKTFKKKYKFLENSLIYQKNLILKK